MQNIKIIGIYFLALSIFTLGGTIIYTATELRGIVVHMPELLQKIEIVTEKINPLFNEIKEVRALIPTIMGQVEKTTNYIPEMIKTTNKAADSIHFVAKEMKESRPVVKKVAEEIESTRKSLPDFLESGEKIAEKINQAGKNTGEGFVTGLVKGVIAAPFNLVSDLGSSLFELMGDGAKELGKEDKKIMINTMEDVLNNDKPNAEKTWKNPSSAYSGKIVVLAITPAECKTVATQVFKNKKNFLENQITLCRDKKGQWIKKE